MSSDRQLFLFSDTSARYFVPQGIPDEPQLQMDAAQLQRWKSTIAEFQTTVRSRQSEAQGSLFELPSATADPDTIDPFSLTLHNFFFFEQPAHQYPDHPCLYFVIDTRVALLLYVGETCKANQRWKGVHDCKRYVLEYRSLHYKYGLETAINTAFFWEAPAKTRLRQQMEAALIDKWRSPFNKENWAFWGTPFVDRAVKE